MLLKDLSWERKTKSFPDAGRYRWKEQPDWEVRRIGNEEDPLETVHWLR